MGTYGAAKSRWHSDSQLFQRPDCARVGRSNKGMQGWASRTWACGRMHFLGSRKLLFLHLWSNRIWGTVWFICYCCYYLRTLNNLPDSLFHAINAFKNLHPRILNLETLYSSNLQIDVFIFFNQWLLLLSADPWCVLGWGFSWRVKVVI